MKRLILTALAALCLLANANAVRAADKPLVMETGQLKQLPAATALQLQAATTANATANEPQGTAPTSPANGDRWTTSSGFFGRAGGVTYGPFNSGTVTSVTCGSPLTGGTFTTTGACSISANALALGKLAQIGGNSYLGNTSSSTGDVTAYAWPTCTSADHALHYNPSGGTGVTCDAIGTVATGANPFCIGAPCIQSGSGAPSASALSAGSLNLRTDAPRASLLLVSSAAVPAVVQSASAGGDTVTMSATPATGDTLVAFCSTYPGTPTVATGWTQVSSDNAAVLAPSRLVVRKLAAAGESTSQTPCNNTNGALIVFEVSGITSWSASYAGQVTNSNTAGGSSLAITTTTSAANTLVLGGWGAKAGVGGGSVTGLSSAATAHAGTNVGVAGAAGAFAVSGSGVSATGTVPSGSGITGTLILLTPGSSSWADLSFLSTIKNAGTIIETNPLSLNCSTGVTCASDGFGALTLTAAATVTTTGSPASGNLAKFSGSTSVTSGDLSGDCTTSGTLAVTCGAALLRSANNLSDVGSASTARTNLGLGTFATANAATPPAIGGTTPGAGTFSSLKVSTITGSTQCAQFDTTGAVSGTGSACGTGGGGGTGTVTSVATNNGLTGGPITASGTIGIDVSGSTSGQVLTSTGVGTAPTFQTLGSTGTWTPAFAFGGGTTGITYTSRVGRYTRFGNIVVATAYLLLSNKGSSTGSATITGLPFTSKNTTNFVQSGSIGLAELASSVPLQAWVDPNSTTIKLFVTSSRFVANTDFTNATDIAVTFVYECEP